MGKNLKKTIKNLLKNIILKIYTQPLFITLIPKKKNGLFGQKWLILNRYNKEPLNLYKELYELIKSKQYFVITTNVDGQFEKAGFEEDKVFEIQGDYAYLQCENACHNKLYYNYELVKKWLKNTKDCKIPSDLVPKCPVCNGNMDMNLRKDANFVQDVIWYEKAKKYEEFLEKINNKNVLLLEIGVGFNTPGIIRIPFEQMVYNNINTSLIRINKEYAFVNLEINEKVVLFNEDTNKIINDLKGVNYDN